MAPHLQVRHVWLLLLLLQLVRAQGSGSVLPSNPEAQGGWTGSSSPQAATGGGISVVPSPPQASEDYASSISASENVPRGSGGGGGGDAASSTHSAYGEAVSGSTGSSLATSTDGSPSAAGPDSYSQSSSEGATTGGHSTPSVSSGNMATLAATSPDVSSYTPTSGYSEDTSGSSVSPFADQPSSSLEVSVHVSESAGSSEATGYSSSYAAPSSESIQYNAPSDTYASTTSSGGSLLVSGYTMPSSPSPASSLPTSSDPGSSGHSVSTYASVSRASPSGSDFSSETSPVSTTWTTMGSSSAGTAMNSVTGLGSSQPSFGTSLETGGAASLTQSDSATSGGVADTYDFSTTSSLPLSSVPSSTASSSSTESLTTSVPTALAQSNGGLKSAALSSQEEVSATAQSGSSARKPDLESSSQAAANVVNPQTSSSPISSTRPASSVVQTSAGAALQSGSSSAVQISSNSAAHVVSSSAVQGNPGSESQSSSKPVSSPTLISSNSASSPTLISSNPTNSVYAAQQISSSFISSSVEASSNSIISTSPAYSATHTSSGSAVQSGSNPTSSSVQASSTIISSSAEANSNPISSTGQISSDTVSSVVARSSRYAFPAELIDTGGSSAVQTTSGYVVQTTSRSVVQTTPSPAAQTTSDSVVQATSASVVQTTSDSVVQTTSESAVQTTSESAVQTTSESAVQTTSGSAVQTTSGSAVQTTSGSAVQTTSGSAVQTTSGSAVQTSSNYADSSTPIRSSSISSANPAYSAQQIGSSFISSSVEASSNPTSSTGQISSDTISSVVVFSSRNPFPVELIDTSFPVQTTPSSVVQTTPDSAVQTTPDSAVQTTPDSAVQTTPDSVVQTTPSSVVQTPPDSSVQTTPSPAAQTTSDSVVQTTPDSAVQTTSDSAVQTTSDSAMQTTSDSVVQTTPSSVVQTPPDSSVQTTPSPAVQTTSDSVVQTTSESAVQTTSGSAVQTSSNYADSSTPIRSSSISSANPVYSEQQISSSPISFTNPVYSAQQISSSFISSSVEASSNPASSTGQISSDADTLSPVSSTAEAISNAVTSSQHSSPSRIIPAVLIGSKPTTYSSSSSNPAVQTSSNLGTAGIGFPFSSQMTLVSTAMTYPETTSADTIMHSAIDLRSSQASFGASQETSGPTSSFQSDPATPGSVVQTSESSTRNPLPLSPVSGSTVSRTENIGTLTSGAASITEAPSELSLSVQTATLSSQLQDSRISQSNQFSVSETELSSVASIISGTSASITRSSGTTSTTYSDLAIPLQSTVIPHGASIISSGPETINGFLSSYMETRSILSQSSLRSPTKALAATSSTLKGGTALQSNPSDTTLSDVYSSSADLQTAVQASVISNIGPISQGEPSSTTIALRTKSSGSLITHAKSTSNLNPSSGLTGAAVGSSTQIPVSESRQGYSITVYPSVVGEDTTSIEQISFQSSSISDSQYSTRGNSKAPSTPVETSTFGVYSGTKSALSSGTSQGPIPNINSISVKESDASSRITEKGPSGSQIESSISRTLSSVTTEPRSDAFSASAYSSVSIPPKSQSTIIIASEESSKHFASSQIDSRATSSLYPSTGHGPIITNTASLSSTNRFSRIDRTSSQQLSHSSSVLAPIKSSKLHSGFSSTDILGSATVVRESSNYQWPRSSPSIHSSGDVLTGQSTSMSLGTSSGVLETDSTIPTESSRSLGSNLGIHTSKSETTYGSPAGSLNSITDTALSGQSVGTLSSPQTGISVTSTSQGGPSTEVSFNSGGTSSSTATRNTITNHASSAAVSITSGAFPTESESNTNWLPYSIIVQSTRSRSTTGTLNPNVTATLPYAIAPQTAVAEPPNSTVITIGFKLQINYNFLVSNPLTSAQIFNFMPHVLAYPFDYEIDLKTWRPTNANKKLSINNTRTTTTLKPNQGNVTGLSKKGGVANFNVSEIKVKQIMPKLSGDHRYLVSVAVLYFPEAYVKLLQTYVKNQHSRLYNNTDSTLHALADLIDPSIPLTGILDEFGGVSDEGTASTTGNGNRATQAIDEDGSENGKSGSLETTNSSRHITNIITKRLAIYLNCFAFGTLLWVLSFLVVFRKIRKVDSANVAETNFEKLTTEEVSKSADTSFEDNSDEGIRSESSRSQQVANGKPSCVDPEYKSDNSAQNRTSESGGGNLISAESDDLIITGENTVYSTLHELEYFVDGDGIFYYAGNRQVSDESGTTKDNSGDLDDLDNYIYTASDHISTQMSAEPEIEMSSLEVDEEGNFVISSDEYCENLHEESDGSGSGAKRSETVESYNNNHLYKITKTSNEEDASHHKLTSGYETGQEIFHIDGGDNYMNSKTVQDYNNSDFTTPLENYSSAPYMMGSSIDGTNNGLEELPLDFDDYLYQERESDASYVSDFDDLRIEDIDDGKVDDLQLGDFDELDEEMYQRLSRLMIERSIESSKCTSQTIVGGSKISKNSNSPAQLPMRRSGEVSHPMAAIIVNHLELGRNSPSSDDNKVSSTNISGKKKQSSRMDPKKFQISAPIESRNSLGW